MDYIEIIKTVSVFISGIITLYIFKKNSGKAEKREQDECIDKIKVEIADHSVKIMTHHQNHETLADRFEVRFKNLETKVNQFENIVPEVQALKLKMEGYSQKIDNLIESIKESKADNKDTIKEIKDMIRASKH
jgi:SMC interacting uncharacterized protein involved in chromosome segregation